MAAPLRLLALAGTAALVAASVVVVAATRVEAGPRPHPVTASCATPAPVDAAGYSTAMNALPQGGDATLSVSLPSGHVAWIYGDTLMPGVGMPHSTVIMQDRGCFRASRTQLLPDDADGTFWWPAAALVLPGGDVLVTARDGFGQRVRAAIAREINGTLMFVRWLAYWPQPPTADGPYYGDGLLLDGDQLRAYGTRLHPGSFGKQLWLASVPVSSIGDPAAWQLGTRAVWGTGAHGVDTAIAAYRDSSGYHLLTLQDSVYGNGPVIALDAPSAGGPFTARALFSYSRPGQLRYNVAAHPEAALRGGELLVTVNNNWSLDDHTVHPVASYQPSYFGVDLP